ncbi:MAG: hypothetical protein AB1391_03795 [Candidatus Micrarchaeota archaeon]
MINMAAPIKKTKVVEKWKNKQWYKVFAPKIFDLREIDEIISNDEANLINRILSCTLAEITKQHSQSSIFTSLKFRIVEVKDKNAYTKFIGHEIASSYIKSLSKRNRSMINVVHNLKTKDDCILKVKVIAITENKVSQNTKKNIYNAIVEEFKKVSTDYVFDQFIQEVIFGKFASKIFNRLKQITPMRRVEVRKSELNETFA